MGHWPLGSELDGKWIRQLRIPRTGSRYVFAAMKSNFYTDLSPTLDYKKLFWGTIGSWITDCSESNHMSLSVSNDRARGIRFTHPNFVYDKTFTVIRHPIDRFRSGISLFHTMVEHCVPFTIDSYEAFRVVMEEWLFISQYGPWTSPNFTTETNVCSVGLRKMPNRWWADQREWIDSTVSVWKYEDGLDETFQEWLSDLVGKKLYFEEAEQERQNVLPYDRKSQEAMDLFNRVRPFVEQYLDDEISQLGYS